MKISRILSYAGAVFFVVYGVLFAIFPLELSELVVDTLPAGNSAVIDMRATYGGMSVAIGILLIILAKNDQTLDQALIGLMLLMIGMASFRILGIIVDGDPNHVMYVYLGLEILVTIASLLCLVFDKRGA